MAEENNYLDGLDMLLNQSQAQPTGALPSAEQDIQQTYDNAMDSPSAIESSESPAGLDDIFNSTSIRNLDTREETSFDRAMQGRGARQMGDARNQVADQTQYGEGELIDPNAVIGDYGQQTARGFAAGWGDLVYGTGDTIDFISAWATPGEVEPTTSVGSWLKKTGEKFQNDNLIVLSKDLEDMTFTDLFNPEFYTSKMSRLLPYALSFAVPYAGGAGLGARLLGRFGMHALKSAKLTSKMSKFGSSGKGLMGKAFYNAGKQGVQLTKGADKYSRILGGGVAANLTEGAYLSGEAYSEMMSEVDGEGNPLFTPKEASNIAAGVMTDNAKWMGLDILSNGMLFGGLGKSTLVRKMSGQMPKPVPFKASAGGLMNFMGSKVSNHLLPAGVMAGLEGIEEGMQEVYQEWIKYTNIQEGKGLDYEPMLTWVKNDAGEYRSDIRDIFWSSVGLGGSMGGTRGYFDSVAERNRLYNKKAQNLNDNFKRLQDAKTPEEIYEAEMYIQDNIISEQLWNYSGDGSGLKSYVQTQVEEGKMPQETADQYIEAIEEAEISYEKHSVNTGLTEAGAKQAFFRETRLKRNSSQQQMQNDYFEAVKKKKADIIQDETKLKEALAGDQAEHDAVMEMLQSEESSLRQEMEFIYTRKKDNAPTAKSTGKRDKRHKIKGMSQTEFDLYTQEGAEEKSRIDDGEWNQTEREQKLHKLSGSNLSFKEWKAKVEEKNGAGYLDQFDNKFVNEGLSKNKTSDTIDSVTDFAKKTFGKAVSSVKSLFGKAKEKVTSEETKKAVEDIKKYTKEEITPSAKQKLIEALEAGKIGVKAALKIIGSGVDKIINNKDIKEAIENSKKKFDKLRGSDQTDPNNIIVSKDEVVEEMRKRKGDDVYTQEEYDMVKKELQQKKAEENIKKESPEQKAKVIITKIRNSETITQEEKDFALNNKDLFTKIADEDIKEKGPINYKGALKKKDKTEVVPKTTVYSKIEERLKKLGRALKLGLSVISKETGYNTYSLKTSKGKSIKFFSHDGAALKYMDTMHNIELHLLNPIKGGKNVIEVNGKYYFQFKQGAPVYESIVEVKIGDKVIGQIDYRDYKAPLTKAKKKAKKGTTLGKIKDSIKDAVSRLDKHLSNSFDGDVKSSDFPMGDFYLEYYTHSGFGPAALTQSIVSKKFPGKRGFIISSKLMDDFGQESVALAIGGTVLINEEGYKQTDLIHELGHIYYHIHQGTPLMKRINKLLYKTDLYSRTKREYPELILMNYAGQKVTLGQIYNIIKNDMNHNSEIESDLLSIVLELNKAEGKDGSKMNELFNSLRVQLKDAGVKEVRSDRQIHLLEETFTRTLEAFSYGTLDSIIENTDAQAQLKSDLMEFYKETKNLATKEEAEKMLQLSDENIKDLTLEAAIKHVLLDFNSGNRKVENSANGIIKKASKTRKMTGFSLVYSYLGDIAGRNLTPSEMADSVISKMTNDHMLSEDEVAKIRQYVEVVATQNHSLKEIKAADSKMDKILSKLGYDVKNEDDFLETEADKYIEEERIVAMPKTTTHFLKKIREIYNNKNKLSLNLKELQYQLYTISKDMMYDPYNFIPALRNSNDHNIKAMLEVLDNEVFEGKSVLTDAKLMELKGVFEGINIETYGHSVLMKFDKDSDQFWSQERTISSSLENNAIQDIKESVKNDKEVFEEVSVIYNDLFKDNPDDIIKRQNAAEDVVRAVLGKSAKAGLIDIKKLITTPILYKGKQQFVRDILFDHKIIKYERYGKKWTNVQLSNYALIQKSGEWAIESRVKVKGKSVKIESGLFGGGQSLLKSIITEGLVLSRAKNYLSMVDNVEQDGISIFNKENGLHNSVKNLVESTKDADSMDKKSILHRKNNIFSEIIISKRQSGKLNEDNPLGLTIQQGVMRSLMNTLERSSEDKLAATMSHIEPSELMASDFFGFLGRLNKGIKDGDKAITYNQPIAVFSDKGRRYYVESLAAHNKATANALLKRIKNNPAYNAKYTGKGASKVFPYTIQTDAKGNYYIVELKDLVKKFKSHMAKNPSLYKGNRDIAIMKGETDKKLSMFLTSYISNRFMAQQALVHDHRQSKNEIDYTKRAAGAIASHTVFDRNTKVEPIIFKDYFVDKEGNLTTEESNDTAIVNDAMGYILPEQAKAITNKYGSVQKVGSVFKFVYHYTEVDNPTLKGKTTYLKFAVHVLTPDMESKSPELKKIADVMRARHKHISESTIKEFNEDYHSIFNHGGLVIAASESAAKLFKDFDGVRSNDHIHDILGDVDIDNINSKQDELYFEGGLEDEIRKYHGLSGEGLGIQLELDKQANERFYPSQLFYNLATNISKDESAIVQRMYQLRKEVMEENNMLRNEGLALKENLTEQDVMNEEDSFKSSISPEVFGVLTESVYGNVDPRYPFLNSVHNSVANGRIINKGTKMFTKGSIGYQSSDLGMGLQSYQKVSDYFEDGKYKGKINNDKDRQFALKLGELFNENPNTLVSESYVPGYLEKQNVEIGDLFIGTRVPAHGKVSSTVFIVKDFNEQIEGTPTSNVTIPAWVSKYWGADLDGDSVHMNFKYSEKEMKGKKNAWKAKSNEFFDLYVGLVSNPNKSNEIKADINFEKDAEAAIAMSEEVYGTKTKEKDSQLTPMGDAEMFDNNVPAKHLVGMVASLQRSFNILSNNNERLPLGLKIDNNKHVKGREITTMFDDASLEGESGGNWYGVAQLLNIVLDNAKHQYASKLGLNMQTVFPYVMLRRLGYSLNELSVIFNAPVIKRYIEFKKSRGKTFISKEHDINIRYDNKQDDQFSVFVEFLRSEGIDLTTVSNRGRTIHNQRKWNKIRNRIDDGLSIDTSLLNNKKKKLNNAEVDALLMMYTLDQWNSDVVKPFSKAFTIHQSIEKNPLELKVIRDDINKISNEDIELGGQLQIKYKIGDSVNNPIVTHALELFDSMLSRSQRADIRFTPYMQSILSTDYAVERLNDRQADSSKPKIKQLKSQIINQVIYNDINSRLKVAIGVSSAELLAEDIQQMKLDFPDNLLVNKVLELRQRKNGTTAITINNVEINELTSLKKIKQIQDSFSELDEDAQNTLLLVEQEINKFGLSGVSIIPFFDQNMIDRINRGIATIIEENQTKQAEKAGLITNELESAIVEITQNKDKKSLEDQIKESGKKDRKINIIPAPKKRGDKIINDEDLNRFNLYISKSVELPSEFFTSSSKFKEFYSKERGVKMGAPDNTSWIKNSYDLYDLVNKEDGDIIIPDVNLKTGHKMTYDVSVKKAKKVINAKKSIHSTSHLKEENKLLSFPDWSMDKGIDLSKIEPKSNTYNSLQHRYAEYKADHKLVESYKAKILKMGLTNITLNKLMESVANLRKMDNSATKQLAYTLESEIGQRMFQEQADFLKQKGKEQGYDYNVPGEDGVPQEDISNYRKWMGANNMTSKRPEMQYLINQAEKEYMKYMRSFKKHKSYVSGSHKALVKSKMKSLSLIERIKKSLNINDKYKLIYGNITVERNGRYRLKTSDEIASTWDSLSKEEQDYYSNYRAVVRSLVGKNDYEFEGMPMQELESLGKSGLLGLYNLSIDDHDYHGVKVRGIDKDGNEALKTFHEWKVYVYNNRTKGFTVNGKEIMELTALRKKAKKFKALGKHEDGSKILLSNSEMNALIGSGKRFSEIWGEGGEMSEIDKEVAEEYLRRKREDMFYFSGDIHTSLLEFTRAKLFRDGEQSSDGFKGMKNLAILTDAAIAFNKNLDNPNASEYLTKWWKESFLEKKKQESVFGKTGDKVIDGFVRLTSLRLLGFNIDVGIGNMLAGKYQELRKRGGKQFIKGETRFWKHWSKSKEILKKHRIIEYSFDEFVHLSEAKGVWGKVEKASFIFMDQTEHYIQGSAFLGMLTEEEFNTGVVSDSRVREIGHKISTIHGEGYTALDQRMLSMYSWGRSLMQFKKWFVTLFADRLQQENINRFGEVEVGSYRAAGAYVNELFRKFNKGELSLESIVKEYRDSSPKRQEEMRNYLRGVSLGLTLMALIGMSEGDDDEQYGTTVKYMKKLQADIFATTDVRRFLQYRVPPSSISTFNNTIDGFAQALRGDEIKRTGPYGKAGGSQALKTFRYNVTPYGELKKDAANLIYSGGRSGNVTDETAR